jgi:hypothetical protein
MTVTSVGIALAPPQVEASLWACAATGRSRFPARLGGVPDGGQARLIVALAHAASTEYDEDDESNRRVRSRDGRCWPICACRSSEDAVRRKLPGPNGRA